MLLLPVACIFLSKIAAEASLTRDKEFLNYHVTQVEYYEPWNEEVPCRHPVYCTRTVTHTNSDGTTYTTTESYECGREHLYDVDYHSERYSALLNNRSSLSISKDFYLSYKKLWNNNTFKDLHRNYHSIDGDMYFTTYDQDTLHVLSYTRESSYENRVQVASSIYNFQSIDSATKANYKLYDYPDGGKQYRYILGDNNKEANLIMQYYNGKYGIVKKFHGMILVFKDVDQTAAFKQESYWKGGNFNEFILCVGIDSKTNDIMWGKVISWTPNERLKVDVESDVVLMKKYNIGKISRYLGGKLSTSFERRHLEEFSYITIEPSGKAVMWTFIITFLVTGGWFIFAVKNDIDYDD